MNARDQKTNVRDFNRTAGNAVMTTKEEELHQRKWKQKWKRPRIITNALARIKGYRYFGNSKVQVCQTPR